MSQSASSDTTMLFSPYRLDGLVLPNRIVMAPMTWLRAQQPDDVPTQVDALYYSQRASAGLIVTEATEISPEGNGYPWTQGIHTEAQRDGWRLVTDAVHHAGGHIFLQLCHVGRVAHTSLQLDKGASVTPSAIRGRHTSVTIIDASGLRRRSLTESPPALATNEIARVVKHFRRAAHLAMQAGFDGVEVDGGNGCLIDQFLRASTNRRTDRYGGSTEKRVRLLAEVTRAVAAEVGANRTGVRLTPYSTFEDMADPETVDAILVAADVLEEQEISYLRLSGVDWDDATVVSAPLRESLRKRYANTIIIASRYDYAPALKILDAGHADLIAFDEPFVVNSDLPRRLRLGLPLAKPPTSGLFGGD
jgi:N-ethylmaleimide reductase